MIKHTHGKLVAFIWSIADDCLRDIYVRGKYRDVILPMLVLRRIDALLEPSKDKVLAEVKFQRQELKQTELDPSGLQDASGYVFYNSSRWSLQKLCTSASNTEQELLANINEYLDGFDINVKEIIDKFKLRAQIRHMVDKNVLLEVLHKFTSAYINLTPFSKQDPEGHSLPALTNLGMGYVFEELIRRFNEENNEEAGEHFTPREVIQLMTHLIFEPIAQALPAIIDIYDPACGSGGMLTESENYLINQLNYQGDVYLSGKEINDETYAICKSDMMIKGKDPKNIRVGSTLSTNEFANSKFSFMLSNPPYGKSWVSEQKYIKDDKKVIDPRFKVPLYDYWQQLAEAEAAPRSSDGQLLFLMEMVDKMKPVSTGVIGARIASVHNGSSLFTGDAGSGESNIRRYLIENDLLDAIIQLPNNMFYNTGITTYIWLLSNNKPAPRQGKVQLIDANKLFTKLRKNLGSKNCELSEAYIAQITQCYKECKAGTSADGLLVSKIFANSDFGYYKVNIERPQRLKTQFTKEAIASLRFAKALAMPMQSLYQQYGASIYSELSAYASSITKTAETENWGLNKKQLNQLLTPDTWLKQQRLMQVAAQLQQHFGMEEYFDFNQVKAQTDSYLQEAKIKLSDAEKKSILAAVSQYDATAAKVIKKHEKLAGTKLAQLLQHLGCKAEQLADFGYFASAQANQYIVYETASELRDSENVSLQQNIHSYFLAEVKPHIDEAWLDLDSVKIGYEISFNKYFYQHQPLRSIEEVGAELLELEKASEGLIKQILQD